MTSKPPREGARWGEDPAPTPEPTPPAKEPSVSPEYTRICEEYGEGNVQKALKIFPKVKGEYPHLEILKFSDLWMAEEVLRSASATMERSAQDGRPHTMPETIELIGKHLGSYLAQNPKRRRIAHLTWNYGDEHQGYAAKAQQEKADGVAGLLLLGLALFFFFLFWHASESLVGGFIVGMVAFFGIGSVMYDSKK